MAQQREDESRLGGRLYLPNWNWSPITNVMFRLGLALFAIMATTILVWAQRDQYQDNTDTPVDFIDALYFSTVSLSTTGYGDITPATDQARLVNIFLITPLRLLFLIDLNPKVPNWYFNLAITYVLENNYPEAMNWIRSMHSRVTTNR